MSEQPVEQPQAPKATANIVRTTPMQNGMTFKPQSFGELMEWAKIVAGSGMVPKAYIDNPGAVLVAVQMGAEVGLGPMASLQNIAVINGRPNLWGDAGLAIVKTHPDYTGISETWDAEKKEATCVLSRRGENDVTHIFGKEDALTAGLIGKDGPWQTNPKRMCQMRARWFAMRDQFPDALRGIGGAEEAQDFQPLEPTTPPAERPRTLNDVVARAKPVAPVMGGPLTAPQPVARTLDDVVVQAKSLPPQNEPPPPSDADAPLIGGPSSTDPNQKSERRAPSAAWRARGGQ